jgi:phosphosulfolactate synthase (CoM biosynthesis protein A)
MLRKIVIIAGLIILLVLLWLSFGPKTISGKVIDVNSVGISGITVRVVQRGWGFSSSLVWDKDYFYQTITDSNGNFEITYYRGGIDAHLQIYRGNYEDNIGKVKDVYVTFWDRPVIKL